MNFPKDEGQKICHLLVRTHTTGGEPPSTVAPWFETSYSIWLAYSTCLTYFAHFPSPLTHHAVPVVSPVPIEVGQVTVFVPPGAAVGQSAVTQRDVVIRVNSGPGPALVVSHSITWRTRAAGKNNACLLHLCRCTSVLPGTNCLLFFCFPVIVSSFIYCSAQRCLPLTTIYSHTHFLFCRSLFFFPPLCFSLAEEI